MLGRCEFRVTGYSEGVALPYEVLRPFLSVALSVLGYTHVGDGVIDPVWKQWLMASCETRNRVRLAQGLGWRTFRVRARDDVRDRSLNEADCPYSLTGLQCKASIRVPVHGGGRSQYLAVRFERKFAQDAK